MVIVRRLWLAAVVTVVGIIATPAASSSARTISVANPTVNGAVSATYPGTAGRGVAFTTTAQASIANPAASRSLTYHLNVVASEPGEECPAATADEELTPQRQFINDGVAATISGRNSLHVYGAWTVCAYVTGGSNRFSNPVIYAVGTINVTEECTAAQTSVRRAEAAVRAARAAVRRAKSRLGKARARVRLRKRIRLLKIAKQQLPERLAKDCPEA